MSTSRRLAALKVRSAVAVFFFSTAVGLADERPVLPKPGPDLTLTGGKSPAEFFGARLANAACADRLKKAREAWVAKADSASVREAYLDTLEACGPCATREIESRKIISVTKTEVWNISDGSCYLDPKKYGKPAFDRMVKFLSHTDNYPAYKAGGLRNILEFVPLDPQTGALKPEWLTFDKPFYVFISVLGPTIFGETMSPQYVILNELKEAEGKWSLSFTGVTAPKGFRPPDVYLQAPSGKKSLVRPLRLPSVLGQWHLDAEGNLRYYTAADFGSLGFVSGFTSKLARHIILETLAHLYEAGAGEKP